jgi:hypothetical protein
LKSTAASASLGCIFLCEFRPCVLLTRCSFKRHWDQANGQFDAIAAVAIGAAIGKPKRQEDGEEKRKRSEEVNWSELMAGIGVGGLVMKARGHSVVGSGSRVRLLRSQNCARVP